jgi:hypothetical protein
MESLKNPSSDLRQFHAQNCIAPIVAEIVAEISRADVVRLVSLSQVIM